MDVVDDKEQGDAAEETGQAAGDKLTDQGSTKVRIAKALLSLRKRATTKPGVRYGDGIKQTEDKGASHPKPGHQKE
ncbi:unnamed protein product [Eruca vesicaria subsp. sativa]|uniref:Uncharacterized protein n=1 Tax=Eruca vesicaria subsp. sativa TaxID=29727 RepID=A0ABC8J380_ERUVS|nr:unnamed protein product [Eruca vesicaria subsp. sativa]